MSESFRVKGKLQKCDKKQQGPMYPSEAFDAAIQRASKEEYLQALERVEAWVTEQEIVKDMVELILTSHEKSGSSH